MCKYVCHNTQHTAFRGDNPTTKTGLSYSAKASPFIPLVEKLSTLISAREVGSDVWWEAESFQRGLIIYLGKELQYLVEMWSQMLFSKKALWAFCVLGELSNIYIF